MNAAVVLAAGKGTRLRSATPKVLHPAAGRPLLGWVLEAQHPLGLARVVVVVGHGGDDVRGYVDGLGMPGGRCVPQAEQRGTGHAVRTALDAGALDDATEVLVLAGDVPAVTPASLEALRAARGDVPAAVMTTRLADPTGYGRILTDGDRITAIVEERDATDAQRGVDRVNTGLFAFDATALRGALGRLTTDNAQGEEYLTDTVALLAAEGGVTGVDVPADEVAGVNDRAQLAAVEATLRRRILDGLMVAGVRVVDPAATYVDAEVEVAADATLLPGTMLHGRTRVAAGAVVGPHSRLTDVVVEADATVTYTVAVEARVGPRATVGPYTHLRAGTVLEAGAKAGGFVEMKKAHIGEGSKVPHLSYVGDAEVGRGVNVGAGVVTVNYDGFTKSVTTIGDGAFVGSDTMLVAPIEVGPGAYVGAGSVITTDVPADALALERGERRTIEGWAARKRERHRKGDQA
ncbi:bifunctional UDP-N-acetylglucosamine diphosphorylase/glucosamine-1-phosphate N-acetyltransferase GlmU [Euzebya sp.]|uniref:bifunctional UDP-N-acetylglucosamine diphosphorylase/glucosamine-1-phosphate N-acetyltransferase GlmU n=1 Tax=Euzebya sp. TaxID=1971409 RepID=UPI0035131375